MNSKPQSPAISRFVDLHKSGCFVIPNPWDIGTAVYLQHLGFEALATTSAGFAFSRGKPDTVSALTRDEMLAHVREIVTATPLPVNADFQNGYADEPGDVAANVALCVATGVAGLSIEDATGDDKAPLYDFELAVERLAAARQHALVVLVGSEDHLQCVEDVLPSVLSRPPLAERPGDLHDARHDPALFVRILEGDRQAQPLIHPSTRYRATWTGGGLVPVRFPDVVRAVRICFGLRGCVVVRRSPIR